MHRHRILIVDDSATARASLVKVLSPHYECIEATDGNEGLYQVAAERPDAVVSDVEMPTMSGIDMLKELRSNDATRDLPVIILTTVTNVGIINEVRRHGCSGVVSKPMQPDYLLAKIKQLISAKRERETPAAGDHPRS
jgi:CheY-like chemotaxis protein